MRTGFALGIVLVLLVQNALPNDFEFVVIGDTRPRLEREDFRNFEALIPRINELAPAFVINVGDLIYGYGMRKEKQWDKYQAVVKKLAPPYYQLPGNHDTFSKAARRVYGRRFGNFYQSFDYGGCHFVLLDTCEDTHWGYIGPRQTEWLEADLRSNALRPVFIFTHFPLWEPDRIKPEYHAFWRERLHPLFQKTGVTAVFGGHYHCYGPTLEIDGIRYFITGGGGAELLPDYRKSGGEHHFIRVKVAGGNFEPRVVTSNGELSDIEADVMGGFRFADRHSSRIGVLREQGLVGGSFPFSVSVENPYKEWLVGNARWRVDASTFSVEPQSAEIRIAPGATGALDFEAKALRQTALLQSLPWLEFDVRSGLSHHRFKREFLVLDKMQAPFLPESLNLDGSLAEWGRASRVEFGVDGAKAEFRAFHDRHTLFLAASIPAVSGQEEEETQEAFADDFVVGIAGWLNAREFGGDRIRLGFRRSGNFTDVRDRTPGHRSSGVPSVQAASRFDGSRTVFEAAIPLVQLRAVKSAIKDRLVLSFSFRLPEPKPAGESSATSPNLNSFSYQVRYGGEALVPVFYADLEMLHREPQKKQP